MHARLLSASLCLALSACGVNAVDSRVPVAVAPVGPPVTSTTSTQPLTADPFVPVLSGHRLAISGDLAIVCDPEGPTEDGRQPQLHFASLSQHALLKSLNLPVGSNPQAIAVANDGYAYVLAVGLGGVIAVNTATQVLNEFSAICSSPADIATRGADVIVACRSGEVVTLTHSGKETTQLQPGLVKIAVDPMDRVFVATQNAEIIEVGVSSPTAPADVPLPGTAPRVLRANTPRRLVPLPQGGVAMLFQQALEGELTATEVPNPNPYSGGPSSCAVPATRPSVGEFDPANGFSGTAWSLSTLATDAAASHDGTHLAVADPSGHAVHFEPLGQRAANQDDTCAAGNPGTVTDFSGVPDGTLGDPNSGSTVNAMPTSVAYTPDNTLVVLSTSPILELFLVPDGATTPLVETTPLRGRTLSDGFRLFHEDPNPGSNGGNTHQSLACASCHPDGLTSGATTTINGVTRRVMPLAGHLVGASIVHWEAQTFHDAVVEGTWHTNMGGPALTDAEELSLQGFVTQLKPPGRPAGDPTQVLIGEAAFTTAGCASCHAPATAFTNNSTADVGHGLHKVPSLVGLVYTAPYMSDGCAPTLEARFSDDACGGGAQHGNAASLTDAQRAALITYLKTL